MPLYKSLSLVHIRKQPRRYFCSQLGEGNSNVSGIGFVKLSAQVLPISTPFNASLLRGHIGKREDPGDEVVSVWAMAEVPNSRSVPSGHDEQFVNQPDEDFHCIICFLPSKEPVLTRCGHRFCRQCLEEYMRRYSLNAVLLQVK